MKSNYDNNEIYFYSNSQNYFAFSNFYFSPFEINGVWWKTVEHFYQACKTLDAGQREFIRLMKNPAQAKAYGGKLKLRDDWSKVRDDIMYMALKAKFTQDIRLRDMLLSTGDAKIYEKSPGKTHWGYKGNNMMGILLMKLRDELEMGD